MRSMMEGPATPFTSGFGTAAGLGSDASEAKSGICEALTPSTTSWSPSPASRGRNLAAQGLPHGIH